VRNYGAKNGGKKYERAVPEQGIPCANQEVSPELAGRNVLRESGGQTGGI